MLPVLWGAEGPPRICRWVSLGVALCLEERYHPLQQFGPHDIGPSCEQKNVSSPWKGCLVPESEEGAGEAHKGEELGVSLG